MDLHAFVKSFVFLCLALPFLSWQSFAASVKKTPTPSQILVMSVENTPTAANSNHIQPRIVGGRRESDPAVIMWQALFLEKGHVVCGGSVISHNKVLTAAHCDIRESDPNFKIRIGGETNGNGMSYPITKTYRHENFTRGPRENPINDLMIVEFYNPDQKLGMWAPRLNRDPNFPSETGTVTTSGYGRLGINENLPGHLRSVNVPVVPTKKCSLPYPGIVATENICAGNEKFDSCKGDSGGPLWTRKNNNGSQIIMIGVVSYGFGCAFPNAPGVYSRISGYLDWIDEVRELPPTLYVVPRFELWKIVLVVSVSIGVCILVVVIVIICVVRRRSGSRKSSPNAEET